MCRCAFFLVKRHVRLNCSLVNSFATFRCCYHLFASAPSLRDIFIDRFFGCILLWYVMNTDGNNLKMINSYSKSSNTSSPAGEINTETLAPEVCAVCGGSGMVTCSYCRGTGKGQTISVLGMSTEQGCTYCGSTGKRLCSDCNCS